MAQRVASPFSLPDLVALPIQKPLVLHAWTSPSGDVEDSAVPPHHAGFFLAGNLQAVNGNGGMLFHRPPRLRLNGADVTANLSFGHVLEVHIRRVESFDFDQTRIVIVGMIIAFFPAALETAFCGGCA